MKYRDEASDVYEQFLDAHLDEFYPFLKTLADTMEKMHLKIRKDLFAILQNKKAKGVFRQLVNELPKVYQFFNDNIDFIEMQNVDKDLAESVTQEILKTLAADDKDKTIADMINRHFGFIKTLMMDRAQKQQQEKVVKKVMEGNKELKENVANQAEFDRLVKEAEKAGEEMNAETKKTP